MFLPIALLVCLCFSISYNDLQVLQTSHYVSIESVDTDFPPVFIDPHLFLVGTNSSELMKFHFADRAYLGIMPLPLSFDSLSGHNGYLLIQNGNYIHSLFPNGTLAANLSIPSTLVDFSNMNIYNDILYVSNTADVVFLVNVSNPLNMSIIRNFSTNCEPRSFYAKDDLVHIVEKGCVSDDYVYITRYNQSTGAYIGNVSTSFTVSYGLWSRSFEAFGSTVYFGLSSSKVGQYDTSTFSLYEFDLYSFYRKTVYKHQNSLLLFNELSAFDIHGPSLVGDPISIWMIKEIEQENYYTLSCYGGFCHEGLCACQYTDLSGALYTWFPVPYIPVSSSNFAISNALSLVLCLLFVFFQ